MNKKELKSRIESILGVDDIFLRTRKEECVQGRLLYFGYRRYIQGYSYARIANEFYKGCNHSIVSNNLSNNFEHLTSTVLKDAWNELKSNVSRDETEKDLLIKENARLKLIVDSVSTSLYELEEIGKLDEVLLKFNHIAEATILMHKH